MNIKHILYMVITMIPALPVAAIRYEIKSGPAIAKYSHELTTWRASLFSEYPYLFKPINTAEEPTSNHEESAPVYEASLNNALMVCAFQGETLIGCMVGMPLSEYHDTSESCSVSAREFQELQQKYSTTFFLNELFIEKEHRSLALMQELYEQLEQAVQDTCSFCKSICLLKIDDQRDHPMRPTDYEHSLSTERIEYALLTRYGFTKTGETVHFIWSTLQPDGSLCMEEHIVALWIKQLQ